MKPAPPQERTRQALVPGSEVAVYGSGTMAAELIKIALAQGIRIRCVLDGNTKRTEVQGIAINSPDDPAIPPAGRAQLPVLIGIFNREVDIVALEKKLNEAGWTWTIDFLEVHALWPELIGDRYWLTRRDFYLEYAKQIERVGALWADEGSRGLYRQILSLRLTGSRRDLPAPDFQSTYFPADVPPWKMPLRLIDCGAFEGDTVRSVLKTGLSIEAIAALEPDPKNYAKLVSTLKAAKQQCSLVVKVLPCGAWGETARLHFKTDEGEAGTIAKEGDLVVECVALDDALADFRPTLIKMDIEGAEIEALRGARELVRQSRSGLAICVYHRPAHLWEIPLLLQEWNLGYDFYLRSHGYSGFDLVLYAMPGS